MLGRVDALPAGRGVCVGGGGGKVRWAVYVFTILGSLRYESIQTRVETLIKSKV